jgi:hypothetical protein
MGSVLAQVTCWTLPNPESEKQRKCACYPGSSSAPSNLIHLDQVAARIVKYG